MEIEKIIFQIIKGSAHNWVRYWESRDISASASLPGEYIEIRSMFLASNKIDALIEKGFKVEKIRPQKINADVYCDVLFKRDLDYNNQSGNQ